MSKFLETVFLGIKFKNPIIIASTDITRIKFSFEEFVKSGVGGIVTKSVTDAQMLQNSGITMFDILDMRQKPVRGDVIPDSYYFFSRGGSMMTIDTFLEKSKNQLELANKYGVVLIGSISAAKVANWVRYAKEMEKIGFPMLELNFGNPHGEAAGENLGFLIGQSARLCLEIVQSIKREVKIPLLVKLTPQITDIALLAKELYDNGVAGVTIMHRFQGMVIDPLTNTPRLGGLAAIGGPWMKPLSLTYIAKVYRITKLEICGSNGVDTARDVLDFILAGAGVVQIGSSMMLRGAGYATEIVSAIEDLVKQTGVQNISKLRGYASDKIVPYQELGKIAARTAEFDIARCDVCKKPCIPFCYFDALKDEGERLRYDQELCSGCGLCQNICPHDAVIIRHL